MKNIENKELSFKKESLKSFYFIGVTTTKSLIIKLFPLWMKELGFKDIKILPYDLKIHDKPEKYRKIVSQIKHDYNCYGALVTTHKMDLFASAKDVFDYLDYYALLLHELSCISKNGNRLEGYAKDPITAGASFDYFIGKDYFDKSEAEILIFGAGGSSIATILHLINKREKSNRPRRIIVVNRSQTRLDHIESILKIVKTDISFKLICNSNPEINDKIMKDLPSYSIVINATGMGKDTPGSPVTDKGLFPRNGWVWEFNYRGELDFMHQAEKQVESRGVKVEDGWIYFIHGWTQVLFQAFNIDMQDEIFPRLKNIADLIK